MERGESGGETWMQPLEAPENKGLTKLEVENLFGLTKL